MISTHTSPDQNHVKISHCLAKQDASILQGNSASTCNPFVISSHAPNLATTATSTPLQYYYTPQILLELESGVPALTCGLILGGVNLLQVAVGELVQQTVDLETTVLDGVDDSRDTPKVLHTLLDVQSCERILLLLATELAESLRVLLTDLAHGLKPDVEDVELVVGQGGFDTSAGSVAAEDDVLDLEVLDAELDGGEEGDVGGVDDVGDVAQHEDLTGLLAQHGGLGDTRVAASYPEDVGSLALCAVLEELGVFGGDVGGPDLVGLEGGGELVVCEEGGDVSDGLHVL